MVKLNVAVLLETNFQNPNLVKTTSVTYLYSNLPNYKDIDECHIYKLFRGFLYILKFVHAENILRGFKLHQLPK